MEEKNIDVVDRIKCVLEEIRPFLNMDGGDVEFVQYDKDSKTVFVKLSGACSMCLMQDETLEIGLLEAIREKAPEVENIVNTPL